MISYSKHLSVVTVFRRIARHIDKVLVWHFLGPVQLAIYSFAELPISKLQTLTGSLWQTAFPKFSEKSMDTLRETLDYKVFLLALSFLGAAGIYIVLAPILFEFLFPQYLQSIPFTQVYALGIVLFAGRVYENVLKAHAKTRWIYISQIGSNIIKILTLLILLPIFGVWGAIISLLAWELTRDLLSFIGFRIA
jgi:O-antigen/teichoic acid export membrane protein